MSGDEDRMADYIQVAARFVVPACTIRAKGGSPQKERSKVPRSRYKGGNGGRPDREKVTIHGNIVEYLDQDVA